MDRLTQLWSRFVRLLNHQDEPKRSAVRPMPEPVLKRLTDVEAHVKDVEKNVIDVMIGRRTRRLETWANDSIAPVLRELEVKANRLEKHMTHEQLQPVIQNFGQRLEQFMPQFENALTKLGDTQTALEAQTDKYKTACQERDAALERERVALQQRDEIAAKLAAWDHMFEATLIRLSAMRGASTIQNTPQQTTTTASV